ncbi:transmembrane protein, putative (macronuclear) [Tetrahymena thermophila SB210]|uniref:Transmembrane protein, putative n=1 Tax=Tetrahymena thermophila (strain SB210) TaxID=312017 RepID=I7M3F5_TETTS|nr:transmembrane protein, putative [Tetrahymena thermophila SB210]EAS03045.2 transmembrane protein, putative [Tetrahymena thermophila SB210]|eukprot:XP_001023290.2 transmembrane protein, putative [Tetrahymena thermophila SB210]
MFLNPKLQIEQLNTIEQKKIIKSVYFLLVFILKFKLFLLQIFIQVSKIRQRINIYIFITNYINNQIQINQVNQLQMVKQQGESDVENQSQIENKPITKKEPKKPKIKKEPKQNAEKAEDKKEKSNAGRPKKNEVSLEQLDFSYSTTSYNISAFSVEFRQRVMCYGNKKDNDTDPQAKYQFNEQFSKFGKKNNKSYFTKETLDDLKNRIDSKLNEQDFTKHKLYNFCENIKLQTDEYYESPEQKYLEHQVFDQLLEKIASQDDYKFNKDDFQNIDQCKVILPFFWQILAQIMICEKNNEIYPQFLELLD